MGLREFLATVDVEALTIQPQRFRPPSGSKPRKSTMPMLNRTQSIRSTPQGSSSNKTAITRKSIAPRITIQAPPNLPLSGPNRKLILTSPACGQSRNTDLDGIAVLSPANSEKRVLRSASKIQEIPSPSLKPQSSPAPRSGISFKTRASGLTKRKSIVSANKRLSMDRKEMPSKKVVHPRLSIIASEARRFSPAVAESPLSVISTAQFEADEMASTMPTPAPIHLKSFKHPQPSNPSKCAEALKEMRGIREELLASHKEILAKQTELFEKQNNLIQTQTEVLMKLYTLIDKKIKNFDDKLPLNDTEMIDDEKENEFERTKRFGDEAEKQYNAIRSGLNCLHLKTPAKDLEGISGLTPHTPKTLLSRTLQVQLEDLFENSSEEC